MGEKIIIFGLDEEWVDFQQSFGCVIKCDFWMNSWEVEEMQRINDLSDCVFVVLIMEVIGFIFCFFLYMIVNVFFFGIGLFMKIDFYNVVDCLRGLVIVIQLWF